MRCNNTRCHYNDECFCSQPDYATIDKNGVCEQMFVKSMTITEKYKELQRTADEAYKAFDSNPNQVTSDTYGMALNNLRDFCVEFVSQMVSKRPDITNCISYEEG